MNQSDYIIFVASLINKYDGFLWKMRISEKIKIKVSVPILAHLSFDLNVQKFNFRVQLISGQYPNCEEQWWHDHGT
ncbi:MAG: hypothetical protein ACRC31_06100 [Cetobacterium sp.]